MSELPVNSIAPGEVGGVPASSPQGQAPHRPIPGQPGSIKLPGGVELPPKTVENMKEMAGAAAATAIQACVAKFHEWQAQHQGEKTPLRYKLCEKHAQEAPPTPHQKPAPDQHQR